MKKISTVIGREARWTQPKAFKQEFELRVGDELVATLRFPRTFSSDATGESADGCWQFKRTGVFSHTIAIKDCNTDKEVGTFRSSWKCSRGTLELPDGKTFRAGSNLWQSRFTFTGSSDEPLIELKNSGCLHHSAGVHISTHAAKMPELPLLVILGWYLDVTAQNDAAVVAAAT